MLDQFETFLSKLKADIKNADAERLEQFFRHSKLSRDAIVNVADTEKKGD
jgi:prephenate dehydrogenase